MSEHKPNLNDNLDFEPDFLRQIPLPFGAERDAKAVAERGPGPDEDRTRELIEAAATHFESVYERHGLEGLDREEASLMRGIRHLEAEVDKAQQRVEVIAAEEAPGNDPVSRSKRNSLKLAGCGLPFDLGNEASPIYQELAEIAKTVQGIKLTAQRRRFRLNVLRNVRHQIQTFGEVRSSELFSSEITSQDAADEGGDAKAQNKEAQHPDPFPLRYPERLGPLFIELAVEQGLLPKDIEAEAAASQLFITGEGEKLRWTGTQTQLAWLFQWMQNDDLFAHAIPDMQVLLAEHFLDREGKALTNAQLNKAKSNSRGHGTGSPKDATSLRKIVCALKETL